MNKRKNSIWLTILVSITIISLVLLSGCDSKSVLEDQVITEDAALTVTASPAVVENGSQSVIVVSLSGVAEGQEVLFEVDPPGAGSLSRTADTTDANGEAATVFTANLTGACTIRVTTNVGGTILNNSTGITITAANQSGTPGDGSGNINLNATPSILLANGMDTATVTMIVTNLDGVIAPESTLVYLTAGEKFDDIDGNGYFTNGVDSVIFDAIENGKWDGIGVIASTAYLDVDGKAIVNYVTGTNFGTVYIRATVTESGFDGYAEETVQLTPDAPISSFVMTADSTHLAVKETSGLETTLLRAIGYDYFGNRVPEGLTVNFIITDGPSNIADADGEHLSNLVAPNHRGPYTAITNSEGVAICPISSGTVSGTIRVRAYADTVLSNATQIMVHAGPPAFIAVGADEPNVQYWGTVNETQNIVAIVSDIYDNPVADSTVVYFTVDEGVILAHMERTIDETGVAKTVWMSEGASIGNDGVVIVTAETSGGTVVGTSTFYNSWYTTLLTVSGAPASILADGKEKKFFVLTGVDLNGNPVIGGTIYEGDANYLTVSSGTLEDGFTSSSDEVKIISSTLDVDASTPGGNDDGIGAIDQVRLWTGATASITVLIPLATEIAYTDKSSLKGPVSAIPGEQLRFTAEIQDRFGNPLGDHTLVMTASAGVVTGASQETNKYGEANGFVWTAPDFPNDITITVQDTDPRGGIILNKKISLVVNPIMLVAPNSLDFGNAQTVGTFDISNSGSGQISWTISDDSPWISISPNNGSTTTETDTITITVDRAALASGPYTGTVTVNSAGTSTDVEIDMIVP